LALLGAIVRANATHLFARVSVANQVGKHGREEKGKRLTLAFRQTVHALKTGGKGD